MLDGLVDPRAAALCVAAVAFSTAFGAEAKHTQALGRGFYSAVAGRWAAGVDAVLDQLGLQGFNLQSLIGMMANNLQLTQAVTAMLSNDGGQGGVAARIS